MAIGLIVGGLASWTANDLQDSLDFQSARNVHPRLSSTSQVAIQNIRYTPLLGDQNDPSQTLNASPPSYCWGPDPAPGDGTVSELTVPDQNNPAGLQVAVWCGATFDPTSQSTRVVTVSACLTSVVPTPSSGSPLNSVQSAAVSWRGAPRGPDDRDLRRLLPLSNPTPTQVKCSTPPQGSCGTGMTINSSTIGVANPTVTSLSSTQGLVTGDTTLTVTGSGFVAGSTTVNFVATNATTNIVLAGIDPTVAAGSTTSLSVTIPPTTTQTLFSVIVSTPDGSSPAGSQATYTYQPVVPTITGITTSSGVATGSAAGGTSLTISGTGFMTNIAGDSTTVNFVNTADPGATCPSSNCLEAPYVIVNQYVNGVQTVTATTPQIITGTTYYVTVFTQPGGTSAESTANEFTFQALYPIPDSINPATGPAAGGRGSSTSQSWVSLAVQRQRTRSPTFGIGGTLNISAANISVSSGGDVSYHDDAGCHRDDITSRSPRHGTARSMPAVLVELRSTPINYRNPPGR